MKVAKLKKEKQKEKNKIVEKGYSLKQMAIITLIVCFIFILFYFITTFIVKPIMKTSNKQIAEVDSNQIIMSQLLNRNEEEYYVLAIKKSLYKNIYSDINYYNLYKSYIEQYSQKELSLKVYIVDLDDALNKNYFSDEINITNDLSKLKINDEVLFRIKSGKIEKTYVGSKNISNKLSRL